jgi:hypothetical protein
VPPRTNPDRYLRSINAQQLTASNAYRLPHRARHSALERYAEDTVGMVRLPLPRRKKKAPPTPWQTPWLAGGKGWRFSLKGSPRHFDDVRRIVEEGGGARVYFGEPLTYERGAGVALKRLASPVVLH